MDNHFDYEAARTELDSIIANLLTQVPPAIKDTSESLFRIGVSDVSSSCSFLCTLALLILAIECTGFISYYNQGKPVLQTWFCP